MNDKEFIYSTLMTIRKYEQQEHIDESMKEITKFCCDYYHIKKGYKDEYGTWIENPEFVLLNIWMTNITGWEYEYRAKLWQRTISHKAYIRFDREQEVKL